MLTWYDLLGVEPGTPGRYWVTRPPGSGTTGPQPGLTAQPMAVEGLVIDQSPPPGGKVRRAGTVTVQVWHPTRRPS